MSDLSPEVPAPFTVSTQTETQVIVTVSGPLSVADAQALATAVQDAVNGVGQ